MGCGKSMIGKQLSKKLNYQFLDLDKYIEEENKSSIAEIFHLKGENYFRELEKKFLYKTLNLNKVVISTGGGAACFFNNIEWMNRSGLTIYIKLSEKSLFVRLANSTKKRPLLLNLSGQELKNHIFQSLAQREPFYSKANLIVKGEDFNIDYLIDQLKSKAVF